MEAPPATRGFAAGLDLELFRDSDELFAVGPARGGALQEDVGALGPLLVAAEILLRFLWRRLQSSAEVDERTADILDVVVRDRYSRS